MSWFNRNGIWFRVKNGSPSDVEKYLKSAENDLINLKARTLGNEVKHFIRPGLWRISSIFGRDEIRMDVVERPSLKEQKDRLEYRPDMRFVPAIHTVNAEGEWKGITLCMNGKFGPPYLFVPCAADNIFEFDWGCWNDWRGPDWNAALRPDPDVYKERMITMWPSFINPEKMQTFSEIPAMHELQGEHVFVSQEYQNDSYWSGGASFEVLALSPTLVSAEVVRDAQFDDLSVTDYSLHLYTEYADGPYINDGNWYWRTKRDGPYKCWGGSFYCSGGGSPSCVDSYSTWVADDTPNIGGAWSIDNLNANTSGLDHYSSTGDDDSPMRWDVMVINTGEYPQTRGDTTFAGLTLAEAGFVYASDNKTKSYHQYRDGVFVVGAWTTGDRITETIGHDSSTEWIHVYGDRFPINAYQTPYAAVEDRIVEVNPRLYGTTGKTDEGWMLCSIVRNNFSSIEYAAFDTVSGLAQYNDPNATFEGNGQNRRHELGIEANNEGLYGFGEFSLVRIFDEGAEKTEQEY